MGIEQIKRQLSVEFFQTDPSPWVNGIAVGLLPNTDVQRAKSRGQQILVFVNAAVPDCELTAIERRVKGAAGKNYSLVRTSQFVGLQAASGGSVSYYAPYRFNLPLVSVGTLGAVVNAGGTQYILGSNHVLSRDRRAQEGITALVAPGTRDATGGAVIGVVSHVVRLKPLALPLQGVTNDQANKVDCALANVVGAVNATTAVDVLTLGPSPMPFSITKTGRTTLTTTSQANIFGWDGFIDFSFGTYYFTELIGAYDEPKTSPSGARITFAEPGDSGALVRDKDEKGVGLVTARAYVFNDSGEFVAYIILVCSLIGVRDALSAPGLLGISPTQIEFWR